MFYFVIEVIAASIAVSLLSMWLKLIPRYQKRKYAILMQVFNTGLLTIVLTLLFTFGIYPSWFVTAGLILLILLGSIWLTNNIVRTSEESSKETPVTS